MKEIECIFCGTKNDLASGEGSYDRVAIEENGYQGRKCDRCGLIYISPRPSLDKIIDLYGHDDAHISADAHIASDYLKRLYARHHLEIVHSFVRDGALLEIGAGAGYFLDEARKMGFEPYGLEFNPVQANFMRNDLKIPCEESPVDELIFGGKKFDIVYHCDVISHLFDPIGDFKKINKVMKDDALLVFETGNLGDVDRSYFKNIKRFQYPDHLFFFSTANLVELLEKTDFQLVKIYRYSILPQLLAQKAFLTIRNLIKQPLSNRKQKTNLANTSKPKNVSSSNSSSVKTKTNKSAIVKSLSNGYKYFNYLLRYQVGKIVPKSKRPQTLIVVAKKKKPKN